MKALRVPILGILGKVIVNWDAKKQKMAIFGLKIYYLPITQKLLNVQSWNLDTMPMLINALCKPSLGAPGDVINTLQAKNGQIVDNFESIYFSKYQFCRKIVCNYWAHYQPPFFDYARLPQLEYYFSCFASFFLLFLFSSAAIYSTFKPLKVLYSEFEQLKITGRILMRLKSGVPDWGDSLQSSTPKFWTFRPLERNESNFRNRLILKINWT